MVPKLSKIVSFLQFFPYVRTVIAIYVYASESTRFALLENGIGYHLITKSVEDISVRS